MVWLMACGTVVALIGRCCSGRSEDTDTRSPVSTTPCHTTRELGTIRHPATPRTVLRVGPAAQVRGELAQFTDEESSGPHATSQPA